MPNDRMRSACTGRWAMGRGGGREGRRERKGRRAGRRDGARGRETWRATHHEEKIERAGPKRAQQIDHDEVDHTQRAQIGYAEHAA